MKTDTIWEFHPMYHNPDKRCRYPDSTMDYCWSYAGHVDLVNGKPESREKFRDMEAICKGCEFFKLDKDTTGTMPEKQLLRNT